MNGMIMLMEMKKKKKSSWMKKVKKKNLYVIDVVAGDIRQIIAQIMNKDYGMTMSLVLRIPIFDFLFVRLKLNLLLFKLFIVKIYYLNE